jgi:hypothetical protein
MKKINYWVVGATFGRTDMYNEFIENGFWYMGWEHYQSDTHRIDQFFKRVSIIKKNDRIAIKRLMGQGQKDIKILAIGIVKKVVKDLIFVDWLVTDMDREVPINGCVGTIYGPFMSGENWTNKVFSI